MKKRNPLIIITLILCGEMIFILPFVLARVFRPTLLAVLDISNFQLGSAFAVYGLVAMGSYFFGGMLADKYPARGLIAVALIMTGLGGLILSYVPPMSQLLWLYGFWGMTTILLFWSAMIRATRLWGGEDFQGRAFGFLEGGRGFVAAMIGTIGVTIFSMALPVSDGVTTSPEIVFAFRRVIFVASAATVLTGVFAWFALGKLAAADASIRKPITLAMVKKVLTFPTVWLQAIIIVCAYTGYKATDNFSLFASDIMGYSDLDSAKVGTLSLWIRPMAAIGAGFLADRFGGLRMTGISFILVALGAAVFASGAVVSGTTILFFMVIVTTSAGINALRGLYFAIMKEGKIPLAYTGTSVGLMSVLGYTPDIFMGPTMGYLLDRSPGIVGHQHLFVVLVVFSLIGCFATYLFWKVSIKD